MWQSAASARALGFNALGGELGALFAFANVFLKFVHKFGQGLPANRAHKPANRAQKPANGRIFNFCSNLNAVPVFLRADLSHRAAPTIRKLCCDVRWLGMASLVTRACRK